MCHTDVARGAYPGIGIGAGKMFTSSVGLAGFQPRAVSEGPTAVSCIVAPLRAASGVWSHRA